MPQPKAPAPGQGPPLFPARAQRPAWPGTTSDIPEEGEQTEALKENPAFVQADRRGDTDDEVRDAMQDRTTPGQAGVGVIPPHPNLQAEERPVGGENSLCFNQVTITSAVYTKEFEFLTFAPCSKMLLWVRKNNVQWTEHLTKYAVANLGGWGDETFLEPGFLSIERRWLNGVKIRNAESGKNAEVTVEFVQAPQGMFTHQAFR